MFERVGPHLDERQRRVLAGSMARALGRGGIVAVAEATGMSRSTLQSAVDQIDAGVEVTDRVRAPGGGRPRLVDRDPTLLDDLDALVERASPRSVEASPMRSGDARDTKEVRPRVP